MLWKQMVLMTTVLLEPALGRNVFLDFFKAKTEEKLKKVFIFTRSKTVLLFCGLLFSFQIFFLTMFCEVWECICKFWKININFWNKTLLRLHCLSAAKLDNFFGIKVIKIYLTGSNVPVLKNKKIKKILYHSTLKAMHHLLWS